MVGADWKEVAEVGAAVVVPFDDVVDLAVVEPGCAVWDGTGRIERAQDSALGAVGEAGGTPEVELAGRGVADLGTRPATG